MLVSWNSPLVILSTSRPHLVLDVSSLLIVQYIYTQELKIYNLYYNLLNFHHLRAFNALLL